MITIVKELKGNLTVNRKQLSSYLNTKISAKDSRPSAQTIGSFGAIVLCVVFGGILILDLMAGKQFLEAAKHFG